MAGVHAGTRRPEAFSRDARGSEPHRPGSAFNERRSAVTAFAGMEAERTRERADWQRRQVAVEFVRSGRHARGVNGIYSGADAMLFTLHGPASSLAALISIRGN